MKNIVVIISLIGLLSSCAPSRFVVPLEKRSQAVAVELGGPMILYNDVSIPVPLISATHAYGWKKNGTIHQSLHLTSLAYGTFQYEAGYLSNLFYHDKSKIGSSYTIGFEYITDRWQWNHRIYPKLDWNFYWYLSGQGGRTCDCPGAKKKNVLFYTGISNWVELNGIRPHGLPQQKRVLSNPQVGFLFYGKKLNWQIESKWIASSIENDNTVVDYIGLNNKGAVGIYFSVFKILR